MSKKNKKKQQRKMKVQLVETDYGRDAQEKPEAEL
jgi:hypothetical protein